MSNQGYECQEDHNNPQNQNNFISNSLRLSNNFLIQDMNHNKKYSNQEVEEDIKKTKAEQSNEFDPNNPEMVKQINQSETSINMLNQNNPNLFHKHNLFPQRISNQENNLYNNQFNQVGNQRINFQQLPLNQNTLANNQQPLPFNQMHAQTNPYNSQQFPPNNKHIDLINQNKLKQALNSQNIFEQKPQNLIQSQPQFNNQDNQIINSTTLKSTHTNIQPNTQLNYPNYPPQIKTNINYAQLASNSNNIASTINPLSRQSLNNDNQIVSNNNLNTFFNQPQHTVNNQNPSGQNKIINSKLETTNTNNKFTGGNLETKHNENYMYKQDFQNKNNNEEPEINLIQNNLVEEEIKCEDHLTKLNFVSKATRFCLACKVFSCDSCIIDFHALHILQAKNRLDDIFKQTKTEIEDLKNKTISLIKHQGISTEELSKFLVNQIKIINNNYKQKEASLIMLKKRIDEVLKIEKDIHNKLTGSLEQYIKEECLNVTEEILNTTKELSERENELSNDFDQFNRAQKGDVIRENVMNHLKQEHIEKSTHFSQISTNNKEKTTIIEKNISSMMFSNSYQKNLNQISSILNDVFDKQVNFFNEFHKENFSNLNNIGIIKSNHQSDDESDVCVRKYPKIQNNIEDYGMKFEDEVISNNNPELEINTKNFIEANHEKFEFLACIRPKSDELYIYDHIEQVVRIIKNNKSNFADESIAFDNFPDNCKYVNLGHSIIMTGGTIPGNNSTSNCYLMFVERKGKEMQISIMPYGNMIQKRERHNIIYLRDRNLIFVCSGFFNDFAEYSDLSTQQWSGLPMMNNIRANATLAYISNRYVYCIGGYHVKEKKQNGIYLNSCEFFDMDNHDKGWKVVDFEETGFTLKNCAMGFIAVSLNSIIVCGGYDGVKYKNDTYKLKFEEEKVNIEKVPESLPGDVIFFHNHFVRLNKYAFNFDSNMNLIRFDPSSYIFENIDVKKV